MVPTDLPQGTADSRDGAASGEMYVRKGQMLPSSEGGWGVRGESVRNSPVSTEVRGDGGEELLQAPGKRLPCSPWRYCAGCDELTVASCQMPTQPLPLLQRMGEKIRWKSSLGKMKTVTRSGNRQNRYWMLPEEGIIVGNLLWL